MKYLKYFESSEEELTTDKIKEMFLDISDLDWTVQVSKTEELRQKGDSNYNNFDFEIVNFFKTLRMPYNLQPKDDGSNIYWGLIGRQFVEIEAAKKEIVRNVSLDRQTRKIKNISENCCQQSKSVVSLGQKLNQ